jgi:hypothetical protein
LYRGEKKGVAGKAICKVMKTKDEQIRLPPRRRRHRLTRRYPPPRVSWKKRLQAVENKGWESKKEGKETQKRRQVLEKSRVKAGAAGGVWEACSRYTRNGIPDLNVCQ